MNLIWYFLAVLIAASIGFLIAFLIFKPSKKNFELFTIEQNITKLARQAARWSTAAKQDKNTLRA